MLFKNLHTKITYYRKLNKLTQEELAQRLNTTAQTVCRLEKNAINLNFLWAERICKALGISMSDFLELAEINLVAKIIGNLDKNGELSLIKEIQSEEFQLPGNVKKFLPKELNIDNFIAIRINDNFHHFRKNTLLIGAVKTLSPEDYDHPFFLSTSIGMTTQQEFVFGNIKKTTLLDKKTGEHKTDNLFITKQHGIDKIIPLSMMKSVAPIILETKFYTKTSHLF